ncbi:PepSY domain-containing protein [Streptomyces sp. NPDC038707]|uniref:PepSY domain-containing protein n=1 Tax=Streptomyces sp. NPDC038707 TaxID=3154329 RepID=UPI00340CC8EA
MNTKSDEILPIRDRPPLARGTALICAAAAAGALLTGCGTGTGGEAEGSGAADAARAAATSPAPSDTGNLTEDQRERKALVPQAKTGYEQALSAAVGAVPDSEPVSVELKGPPGSPRWEAEVAMDDGTAHTVSVDAIGGKAGRARAKDEDGDDKRELADLLKKATVTPQQAAQTATGRTKGTVTAVELDDTDGGAPKWSVDVVTTDDWNKTTFDIDATNRKILREHVDRD